MDKFRPMTILFPPPLLARIEELAGRRMSTASQVAREAVLLGLSQMSAAAPTGAVLGKSSPRRRRAKRAAA
jgi:hypothetical protein